MKNKNNKVLPLILFFIAFIIFSSLIIYNIFSIDEVETKIQNNYNNSYQSNPDIIKAQLDNSFTLLINQTAYIESGNIKLKFLNVKEDTRCPKDVFCIDKGWIRLDLEFYQNGKLMGEYEIAENYQNTPSSIEIDDYTIRILDVSPHPQGAEKIPSENYKSTFLIKKA